MAPPLFNQGDIGRQYLGANGTLKIFKCIQSNQIIVQYIDDSGEKKFEAEAPLPETAHLQLQGNAGYEPCIMWDAYNKQVTSGGTIVKGGKEASNPTMFRQFFFWFRSREQLTAVLSHLLYHDMSLLEEFFDDEGRFFAKNETKPSHQQIRNDDDMDVDDDHIEFREPAIPMALAQQLFGMDPYATSQIY